MKELNNFAIMRFEKLKSLNETKRALLHCYREQRTENADPKRKQLNEVLTSKIGKTAYESFERMKKRLGRLSKPIRKNAVLAVEAIFTASPEAMEQLSVVERRKYFIDATKWIMEKVGSENILLACIHRDETSEHCHLLFIPIVKGGDSLNCRALIGGHRNRASELQDEFYHQVAKKYGLKRGKKGSKATHQSLKEHSSLVNHELPTLKANKRDLMLECDELEKRISRGKRILSDLQEEINIAIEAHKNAARYTLSALKERLIKYWNMIYEGDNRFTMKAEEFIEEAIDKPKNTLTPSEGRSRRRIN